MDFFYVSLEDFDKHEIANAGGKYFRFTELICESENPLGFVLQIEIVKNRKDLKGPDNLNESLSVSTVSHTLFSNRKTHFGFESHSPIRVQRRCRLFVRLIPAGISRSCKSKLLCELSPEKE